MRANTISCPAFLCHLVSDSLPKSKNSRDFSCHQMTNLFIEMLSWEDTCLLFTVNIPRKSRWCQNILVDMRLNTKLHELSHCTVQTVSVYVHSKVQSASGQKFSASKKSQEMLGVSVGDGQPSRVFRQVLLAPSGSWPYHKMPWERCWKSGVWDKPCKPLSP